MKGQTDEQIWNYAKVNGFIILSKDQDFYQRALLYGAPPKFVWLCLGNCTRDDLLAFNPAARVPKFWLLRLPGIRPRFCRDHAPVVLPRGIFDMLTVAGLSKTFGGRQLF